MSELDDLLNALELQSDPEWPLSAPSDNNDRLEGKWAVANLIIPPKKQIPLAGNLLFERTPEKRRYLAGMRLQSLLALMPELPDENTDVHIVATGGGGGSEVAKSFGFGSFLEHVINQFGAGCVVHLSTWSMNRDHAFMILELLDSGMIANMSILTDRSFITRKHEIASILKHGVERFEGSQVRFFRNHAKIYCLRNRDSTRFCTITGSANLSGNPRAENYTLSTNPDMYQHFINSFFVPLFDRIDAVP